MAAVREVAFELECFEWAEQRLEVAGRWRGLGGLRLGRPVLTVSLETGKRKRLVALPDPAGSASPDSWRATFAWAGDPSTIAGAELEAGRNLVVELPLPDRRRRRRRNRPAPESPDEALRAEVVALREQLERTRTELAARERELLLLRARLDDQAEEPGEPRRSRLPSWLRGSREPAAPADAEPGATAAWTATDQASADEEMQPVGAQVNGAAPATEPESVEEREREPAVVAAPEPEPDPEPDPEPTLVQSAPAPESASAEAQMAVDQDPTLPSAVAAVPADDPDAETHPDREAVLEQLRARLKGVFAHGYGAPAEEAPAPPPVAAPRRTAAAARARAGATVAARRSAAEVWGLRALAAIVVAVLLVALLLFLLTLA